jgi:hypothetical protein
LLERRDPLTYISPENPPRKFQDEDEDEDDGEEEDLVANLLAALYH